MKPSIVLGIGTGRCGLRSLAALLNRQPETYCFYDEPPLLKWQAEKAEQVIKARFERLRSNEKCIQKQHVADVASFHLPYLEAALQSEPAVRAVCFRRPREDVVSSVIEWLESSFPLPTNHWAESPAPGWHHDPIRTRTYPQFSTQIREEGIRRYWDEYYARAEALQKRYPDKLRIFDTYETLNTAAGVQDLLEFAGIPPEQQVASVGIHIDDEPGARKQSWARRSGGNPMDPKRCVILVPFSSSIIPPCERALQALERRGYEVRRIGGYAAIDQGRNQMATDALCDGYEETMWIDSDVDFHPDAVDRLRSHNLPICIGIYPQKGKRTLASHVLPGTPKLLFGPDGGLVEILYAAAGFLHVRREVYMKIQTQKELPLCNERFGSPTIPFFQSMLYPIDDGHWYLAEDWAFCQRARECGYKIVADTTIRLWHVGSYAYGWEDSGRDVDRYDNYTLNLGPERVIQDAADGNAMPPIAASKTA